MSDSHDIVARLEAELETVLTEQEIRLVKAAHDSGFFDYRVPVKEIRSMFKAHIDGLDKPKRSKYMRLKMSKQAAAAQKRKDETRIKIILGAYMIARLEHFPEQKDELLRGLEEFIRADTREHAVMNNLALMKDWISEPAPK